MKMGVRYLALQMMSSVGFACTDTGAFGFEFGKRVPASAEREQHSGGSVANAMGCFFGLVPTPFPGFDKHAYCANRDRKFVYGMEGYVELADAGADWRTEATLARARELVPGIKQAWEEKFGLKFLKDFEQSELHWTAESPTLYAHISLYERFLVVECTSKQWQSKAIAAGLKSM
jgi:hypothetical protein